MYLLLRIFNLKFEFHSAALGPRSKGFTNRQNRGGGKKEKKNLY
jgi:hypothetical protein